LNRDATLPSVWLITDNKPGHRNQLRGLADRLQALTGASLHWINASDHPTPLWRAVLGIAPVPEPDLPPPNLIIAAGTGTHRLLLAMRRHPGAHCLVLMKPGFPVHWIDGAIIPAHDRVQPAGNILVTEGAINAIRPLAGLTPEPEALVLVGGPSDHFQWDDNAILAQTSDLIARYPHWRWTISDSRRTPQAMSGRLSELQSRKVSVISHNQTPEGWLNHQLAGSRVAWVTPDSLSMVCEAVTSGVPAGLLDLPARPGSRVARGVERLVEKGLLTRRPDHDAIMGIPAEQRPRLWEADRAARWVIKRFLKNA